MAMFYTYTDPAKIESEFAYLEPEDKEKKNLEMAKRDVVPNHYETKRKSSDSSVDEEIKGNTKF